ncbi:hypothetical protein [Streptomyces chartreusis]|uniref:hypothetical protein n=1 Tax=Streptomyces chartreusis TaxID=1969 RepID=UPI003828FCA6
MRTTPTRARRLVTAVAGAALVTGCGGAAQPSPAEVSRTTASPAPFNQQNVRAELEAAAAAAGAPAGLTQLGSGASPGPGATGKERKLNALTARLSPCTVSWSHKPVDASSSTSGPDRSRQQLDAVLSDLVAHGWKKAGSAEEKSLGDDGTYFLATYKKRGWTLHARHTTLATWSRSTALATEDVCFDRLTDDEAALLKN